MCPIFTNFPCDQTFSHFDIWAEIGAKTTRYNKMHNQWRGSVEICSLVFQITFGIWDGDVLLTSATAYA